MFENDYLHYELLIELLHLCIMTKQENGCLNEMNERQNELLYLCELLGLNDLDMLLNEDIGLVSKVRNILAICSPTLSFKKV